MRRRWWLEAACRGCPDGMFHPEEPEDLEQAKTICRRCPVLGDCLEEAVAWPGRLDYGVWVGTTPEERAFLRRLVQQGATQDHEMVDEASDGVILAPAAADLDELLAAGIACHEQEMVV